MPPKPVCHGREYSPVGSHVGFDEVGAQVRRVRDLVERKLVDPAQLDEPAGQPRRRGDDVGVDRVAAAEHRLDLGEVLVVVVERLGVLHVDAGRLDEPVDRAGQAVLGRVDVRRPVLEVQAVPAAPARETNHRAAVPGDEPDAPDDASSLPPPHADSSAGSEIPAAPSTPARDQELASRERRSATEWEWGLVVAAGHGKPFTLSRRVGRGAIRCRLVLRGCRCRSPLRRVASAILTRRNAAPGSQLRWIVVPGWTFGRSAPAGTLAMTSLSSVRCDDESGGRALEHDVSDDAVDRSSVGAGFRRGVEAFRPQHHRHRACRCSRLWSDRVRIVFPLFSATTMSSPSRPVTSPGSRLADPMKPATNRLAGLL